MKSMQDAIETIGNRKMTTSPTSLVTTTLSGTIDTGSNPYNVEGYIRGYDIQSEDPGRTGNMVVIISMSMAACQIQLLQKTLWLGDLVGPTPITSAIHPMVKSYGWFVGT